MALETLEESTGVHTGRLPGNVGFDTGHGEAKPKVLHAHLPSMLGLGGLRWGQPDLQRGTTPAWPSLHLSWF